MAYFESRLDEWLRLHLLVTTGRQDGILLVTTGQVKMAYFFFSFFFCQAHHCGAFIQKHSSIVTVFLSLTHSHVFV